MIILGVLVALAVDQWNQDRENRELEGYYLAALERDLVADSQALALDIERAERSASMMAQFDSALSSDRPSLPPDVTRAVLIDLVAMLVDPPYSTGTLEDLATTGRASLIQDPELRGALFDYRDYTKSSRVWLAEWRSDAGLATAPGAVLASPAMEWIRDRGTVLGEADAEATVRAIAPDPSARAWVRRKRFVVDITAVLLRRILTERTLPLLAQVRASR